MSNHKKLMQALGYTFKDAALLELALSHRSLGNNNNERLEFLGDSILNFIIAAELFTRFSKASEGQLTRMRAHFICAEMLTEIARSFDLGNYIILGAGEQRSGGHQRASILADGIEAIIGAIYLDSGADYNIVRDVVINWFVGKFEAFNDKKLQNYKDPKTVIQELLQSKKLPLPIYEVTKIEGERHDQTFYVQCKVVLLADPVAGVGNSRRKAEQRAAELVLEIINSATRK
jgi:ribonuclease-3